MSGDDAQILAANRAFYDAFAARDAEAIDALWARGAPSACTHPGWPVLVGRAVVMQSWRDILASESAPRIAIERPRALRIATDVAMVVCVERIGRTALAATNLFVHEEGAWRIVHHHAGPMQADAPEEPDRQLN